MRKFIIIFFTLSVFIFLANSILFGQSIYNSYYYRTQYQLASSHTLGYGLYGFANPAAINFLHQPSISFAFTDRNIDKNNDLNDFGLFFGAKGIGFSMYYEKNPITNKEVKDYQITLGGGDNKISTGSAIRWSTGDTQEFGRKTYFSYGIIFRPDRHVSIGALANLSNKKEKEGVFDLALRPLGNELITIFGDYVVNDSKKFDEGNWSTGALFEILPGVRFTGRYFDDKHFTFGLDLSFGRSGISTQSHFNNDRKYDYQSYIFRLGAYDRNIITPLKKDKKYLDLTLNGNIRYQKYTLFDSGGYTLIELLDSIEKAKYDNEINGIVLNISTFNSGLWSYEKVWELRNKLVEFKKTGKKIIVYSEEYDMVGYYLASVADKIILDPLGGVMLEGFVLGNMYLKGTLDKIGLGIDELRFFKYKSAAETISRTNMSEADREQRTELLKSYYSLMKNDIIESRKISETTFEEWINKKTMFVAEDAIKYNVVDTLARWDAINDIINKMENKVAKKPLIKFGKGKCSNLVSIYSLEKNNLPTDNYWGQKPQIAIIYALGECAMDYGITSRKLVKDVEKAVNDNNIKAIILRVDSPGGSALASDVIAEALKKAKGKKPVIVSQGAVAASGGYWLSMYGDVILAAPNTITGSIGVIGAYIYDNGLKNKLGITTDFVKIGDHADFGFGVNYPFVGKVPDRKLTDEERLVAENSIKHWYKQFVEKVALGRKKSFDEIEKIAQGRVWSGIDGKKIGIVDELGGLDRAIQLAKEKANLKDDEFDIVEMPKKTVNFERFMPKPSFSYNTKIINYFKLYLDNNGKPLPLLPLDIDYIETIE